MLQTTIELIENILRPVSLGRCKETRRRDFLGDHLDARVPCVGLASDHKITCTNDRQVTFGQETPGFFVFTDIFQLEIGKHSGHRIPYSSGAVLNAGRCSSPS